MVDYTTDFEEKDWEREKENVSPSPAALQHREREKFCVRKLNFKIFIMPQWIFWEDNISFYVVFGAAVYRPSSRVDYTAERRKTEREREKENVSPLHHGRPTTERRSIVWEIKMKRFLNFNYATMKFLIFHKFCSFWSSCVRTFFVYGRLHSREKKDWEREKFLYVFPITSRAALQHREKKFCMRKKNF